LLKIYLFWAIDIYEVFLSVKRTRIDVLLFSISLFHLAEMEKIRPTDNTVYQNYALSCLHLTGTVSRDGGRDETMMWQIRPKVMVATPFFDLKIAILKVAVHTV
jgi:hypothetical protein